MKTLNPEPVRVIDLPQNDLAVVNAARVSFAKRRTEFITRQDADYYNRVHNLRPGQKGYRTSDEGLIEYLAKHDHWTPFAHNRYAFEISVTDQEWLRFLESANLAGFAWNRDRYRSTIILKGSLYAWISQANSLPARIRSTIEQHLQRLHPYSCAAFGVGGTNEDDGEYFVRPVSEIPDNPNFANLQDITFHFWMPIFVRSQWYRHSVGIVRNEVSRRYVDDTPTLYLPAVWRSRPENGMKQGSSPTPVTLLHGPDYEHGGVSYQKVLNPHIAIRDLYTKILDLYEIMIQNEVAPEQARMILPQSMYTEFYETASVATYARICKLRLDPHAQQEIREYAQLVSDAVGQRFPNTWKNLMGDHLNEASNLCGR